MSKYRSIYADLFASRAAYGAKTLDKVLPGWEVYVDWHKLDLDSVTNCVLGQIGRRDPRVRSRVIDPFGINPFRVALCHVEAKLGCGAINIGRYGFTSAGDNRTMAKAWGVEIEKRLKATEKVRAQERARKAAKKDLRILPPDEKHLAQLLDKSAYELVA